MHNDDQIQAIYKQINQLESYRDEQRSQLEWWVNDTGESVETRLLGIDQSCLLVQHISGRIEELEWKIKEIMGLPRTEE